jgi:hypothetical protein
MQRNENIFIKLGLEKNFSTGKLSINIQFDPSSPNFCKDKETYSWCPTEEEWALFNEAFELIQKAHLSHFSETKKERRDNTSNNPMENSENKPRYSDKVDEYVVKADEHEIVNKFLEKSKKV